jgi:hypothetical protein
MEQSTQKEEKKWSWIDHKPDNMFTIEGKPEKNFFKWWCILMTPFINLTPKEIDLVASLLKQRHELSKKISDPALVDSQLKNNDTRQKVLEECGITLAHYYVLMSNLRSKGIVTEAGLNSKLIPRISKDNNGYCQLLILFKDPIIK